MRFLSVCSGIEAASAATPSKRCAKCGVTHPLDGFHKHQNGPQGRHSYCKGCANTLAREKRVRNDTPEMRRKWLLSQRYGITPAQSDAMVDKQNGLCAICELPMKRPVTDHNHATGVTREKLCHGCNIKLHAVEDATFLSKALAYLEKHK